MMGWIEVWQVILVPSKLLRQEVRRWELGMSNTEVGILSLVERCLYVRETSVN
jgi:hypothetical protein